MTMDRATIEQIRQRGSVMQEWPNDYEPPVILLTTAERDALCDALIAAEQENKAQSGAARHMTEQCIIAEAKLAAAEQDIARLRQAKCPRCGYTREEAEERATLERERDFPRGPLV